MEKKNTPQKDLTTTLSDKQKFTRLSNRLIFHGFREIPRKEKSQHQKAISLVVPKGRLPRPGQVGFMWVHSNGTRVFCWPTYDKRAEEFIKKGRASSWVLILDKDGVAHHKSRQIRRVGKFCKRILWECLINKTRVASSAYCPSCGAPMNIRRRREYLRGRYWICSRASVHRKKGEEIPILPFNHGIEGELLVYVNKRNKLRGEYANKRRKEGKDPQHQMKTRKKWQKTTSA